MFETLLAKTFTLLGSQLFVTWLVTVCVIGWIRHLYHSGANGVTAKKTFDGRLDLELEWSMIKPYFWTLFFVDFAVFLVLLFKGTRIWL